MRPSTYYLLPVLAILSSLCAACALHPATNGLSDVTLLLPGLSVRQVDARDFTGTFSGLLRNDACPAKLKHDGLVQGGNAVAHVNITVNGVRCNDNGRMNLFPVQNADRLSAALSVFDGASKVLAENLIDSAKNFPGSYIGTSNVARICGKFTYNSNTLFVFVKANRSFPTVSGWPDLPAKQRNMVSIQPGQSYVCPFSAKLRESPTPKPNAFPPSRPNTNTTTTTTTTEPATPEASGEADVGGTVDSTTTDPTDGGLGPIGEPGLEASPAPDGSVCFPGSATVELRDGSRKPMHALQVGDYVRVAGADNYSPVFMFTHKLANTQYAHFIRIIFTSSSSSNSIALTPGHYLLVNGRMAAASTVAIGDTLQTNNDRVVVVGIERGVELAGLYNPQTVDGTIVVDGVVASTYTTAVEPTAAHTMLAPLRAAFSFFGITTDVLNGGADTIATVLPGGNAAF